MFWRLIVSVRVQGERHQEEEGDGGGFGGRSAGNAQEEEKGESANPLVSLYQVEKRTLLHVNHYSYYCFVSSGTNSVYVDLNGMVTNTLWSHKMLVYRY